MRAASMAEGKRRDVRPGTTEDPGGAVASLAAVSPLAATQETPTRCAFVPLIGRHGWGEH